MPLHDWTRATPGMFPDFHSSWLTYLKNALNKRLPDGYYAMAEQRASLYAPDVQTVTGRPRPLPVGGNGAVALADPTTDTTRISRSLPVVGRALTIRRSDGMRIVAIIEVVSPRNKDRAESVGDFAGKVAWMVRGGIHAVVLDILPPGHHDPAGMHAAIWPLLDEGVDDEPVASPPADRPYSFAGYRATDPPVSYVSFGAVGRALPPVPLFLDDDDAFVNVPVEETYTTNYAELPGELRGVLG